MSLDAFQENLNLTYNRLRSSVQPRDYEWRVEQLKALGRLLSENEELLFKAMWEDLRKSKFECVATENGVVISEIDFTLKHLSDWMKPKKTTPLLLNQPSYGEIHADPFGLVLVIGAWNYPIQLLLAPLVGAIAGGNSAILKPSEMAANTAQAVADLIPKYMDANAFAVIQGGVPETQSILDKVFDMIFFTGSGPVGKIILAKAAPHLTPVILELGGKSPALILPDANLEVAASRIAWGKFMNAGQTCVAPDYVLVHSSVKEAFTEHLKKAIASFYGEDVQKSPDYCRIVNTKNFDRLMGLMASHKIIHGGKSDRNEKYIEPTLIDSPPLDSALMQEEIFGPLLPLIEAKSLEEMIAFVNARPKPLALYLFSASSSIDDEVLLKTSSGGVCINDVVVHLPEPRLPFGGVGPSGMGRYHGQYSFDAFTHAKGVLRKTSRFDLPLRYPPYTASKLQWMRRIF